jgi:ABC-type uncharacterized transport system permease subunit
MSLRWRVERRLEAGLGATIAIPVLAVAVGLAIGGLVIQLGGTSAISAYGTMWGSSFGSMSSVQATLMQATPLILTGLAVLLPLRMGLWNIGGEGQLTVGAIAATDIGLHVHLPAVLLLPAMFAGGAVAGGAWALLAAVPRALRNVNEIIVTLFLNYVAILLMQYLVNGPWADRSAIGFAYSRPIPSDAMLPALAPGLTIGILISLAVALMLGWVLNWTPTGVTIRLLGSGPGVSRYLRLPAARMIVAGLTVAGAIAGLAGVIQLTGVTLRLEPGISSNYGYTGILVAFLARSSVPGVLIGSVLYGALINGGFGLEGVGVSSDIATVVQALIVLFLLAGHNAVLYRLRRDDILAGQPGTATPVVGAETR